MYMTLACRLPPIHCTPWFNAVFKTPAIAICSTHANTLTGNTQVQFSKHSYCHTCQHCHNAFATNARSCLPAAACTSPAHGRALRPETRCYTVVYIHALARSASTAASSASFFAASAASLAALSCAFSALSNSASVIAGRPSRSSNLWRRGMGSRPDPAAYIMKRGARMMMRCLNVFCQLGRSFCRRQGTEVQVPAPVKTLTTDQACVDNSTCMSQARETQGGQPMIRSEALHWVMLLACCCPSSCTPDRGTETRRGTSMQQLHPPSTCLSRGSELTDKGQNKRSQQREAHT